VEQTVANAWQIGLMDTDDRELRTHAGTLSDFISSGVKFLLQLLNDVSYSTRRTNVERMTARNV